MSSAQEHMAYIQEKVNPILEALVTAALLERPEDPAAFMVKWLCEQKQFDVSNMPVQQSPSGGNDIEKVKKDIAELKAKKADLMRAVGMSPAPGEEDEEDDDDDDVVEDMPPPASYNKGPRSSVSAEAYGAWNTKKEFVAPVHAKSEDQKKRIREVLGHSFLFNALEDKDLETVILAMKEQVLEPAVRIIKQGDDGQALFVVESGVLDCYKEIQGEEKLVKTCTAGDAFGELALLYNCPRAASVQTREKSVLWELDRESFNYIVKDAAAKKRELYESFLKKVPLLENVEAYERMTIADALKPENFTKGEYVIKQGDMGDKFFIILEGEGVAMKAFVAGQEPKEVHRHVPGDYFGELALLKGEPRAASIVADSDMKCLSLDRRTFKRLLGPLEDILRRQSSRYQMS